MEAPRGAAGPLLGLSASGHSKRSQAQAHAPGQTRSGKTVPVGEYSLFIDLKPNNWTFVVSTWPAQTRFDPNNKDALWGSYNYTPDKDVVRAPMTLTTLPASIEQLTWVFSDMSDAGGKMTIMWDKNMASVPFKVGTP